MSTSQLIPVFEGTIQYQPMQLSNARDLHATLEVGRQFSHWIQERIEQYGFVEGEDFIIVKGKLEQPNLAKSPDDISDDFSAEFGRPQVNYHLTLDMAKELAMIENNPRGREVRRYFIRMERRARLFAQPLIPTDKKAARDTWKLFREVVADNIEAGMDEATAWATAGAVTKEATGANLLEYMGHPHIGGEAALRLAHKEDTQPVKGFKSPQGKLLDWKQKMALHMAVVDLMKAAPEKFQYDFMTYGWLTRTMNVTCEEQIPQHRFIEALNILRVKTECERAA